MRRFQLNKLIRDKVFASMQRIGEDVKYHKLTDEELLQALKAKFHEEANEFDPADPKAVRELADLLEIIETAAKALGIDFETLRIVQAQVREERGGFDDKIFIESVGTPDGDKWGDYYASQPERFPELPVKGDS